MSKQMLLTSKVEGGQVVYRLVVDEIERKNAAYQPGDREYVKEAAKNPAVSEKLCALALICKRIEEGRLVGQALEAAQQIPPGSISRPGDN